MGRKPDSIGRLLLELLGVRWDGSYENDVAIEAGMKALDNEPSLDKEWLQIQLYKYEEQTEISDWNEYMDKEIKPKYKELKSWGFNDEFNSYYESLLNGG